MFSLLKPWGFPVEIPPFRTLLLTLMAIDVGFIMIHLMIRFGVGVGVIQEFPVAWDVFSDHGMPEMSNHIKWALIALCLLAMFALTRVALFAAMAVGFTIVLLDDGFVLHETWGEALAERWDFLHRLGIAPWQAGEMMVWAGFGVIIVAVAAVGYLLTPREWRRVGLPFLVAFVITLFFAVGLDIAQEPFRWIPHEALSYWSIYALRILEEAGEFVSASLILTLSVTMLASYRAGTLGALAPVGAGRVPERHAAR